MKDLALILSVPLALMVITFYVLAIASVHKALKSISESDYWLKKPWKWTFEAAMFTVGVSIMFVGYNLRPEPIYLLVISGAGIFGVGVFARFKKNKFVEWAHVISANIGFGALILSFIVSFHNWYALGVQILSALLAVYFSRKSVRDILVWNLEVFLIYSAGPTLFIFITLEILKIC